MKVCMMCRKKLPLTEFAKYLQGVDGYRSSCKACLPEPAPEPRRRPEQPSVRFSKADWAFIERCRQPTIGAPKECTTCRVTKPATDYHINTRTRDGRSYTCKPCKNAQDAIYRQNKKKTPTARTAGVSSSIRKKD